MKILVIDDQNAILESLSMFFSEKGLETLTAEYGKEGLEKVQAEQPDIVILDIRLPDINGIEVLKKIRSINDQIFVIMITAFHDMETTIEAMKYGAYDYIHKPINIDELDVSINKVADTLKLKNNLSIYLNDQKIQYKLDTIIGKTKSIQQIFKLIGLTCNNKATVLIQGESGTGKELISKAIHYNGIMRDEPFVGINCSALVETLLESELFGHEKGAFTNALYAKKGKFELARNGTIFLDEISELPLSTQAKILRFLQEKEFERVGGEKTIKSDTRIIAATNKNLVKMVRNGSFREDLFFRLKVITISVPPLKERKSDIPLLVDFFLHKISKELHKRPRQISQRALEKIMQYGWPGNVRELENVLMRAVVLSRDEVIMEEHISIFSEEEVGAYPALEETHFKSLEELEKEHIKKALLKVGGQKGKACELLKISRPTLRKKIQMYDIRV
ncbi:MAG: sigma-54 dependent transcriptional regulator [Methanosarcinaceae archaeon]|nr:sigma-54 dependent transcriptional regulator [Methanosarcinaceae archaeon]